LTAMVLLPCFVPTTPVRYFESDPRIDLGLGGADALTELGPVAVAWVQALTAAVAGFGLFAALWAGARLSKVAVGLTALGMAAVVFHMTKTTARWEDWTQGGAWLTAAIAGLAGMHLAQFGAARRWITALCVAAALPLVAEAGWYVFVEHPVSVEFFETHRAELLAARGMTPGSEAAALYERRLRFADATGTFGLSNVLASVAATIGLAGLGLVLAAKRRGRWAWRLLVAAGLATAASLLVVGLTASKGAAVAVAAVMGLAGLVTFGQRVLPRRGTGVITAAVALGIVACAFGAVLVRGAMGPPAPPTDGFVAGAAIDGERSLLFRAHYWSAAARIAADHPLLGSGPRGFADAYPAAKNPLNPESVTSSHNVLVDQIAMLGLGGAAWSGLLLWWLWRAGRAAGIRDGEVTDSAVGGAVLGDAHEHLGVQRSAAWAAVGAAVVVFGVTLGVRQSSLYLDTALLWLIGIAGFVAVAATLGSAGSISGRGTRVALLLAAAVALTHNQIEMAFFQPASMGLLWLIVGAAGGGVSQPVVTHQDPAAALEPAGMARPKHLAAAGIFALIVLVIMVVSASRTARHESTMAGAEAALRRGDTALAQKRLAEAQHAAGLDTRALRWRVQLHALEPMAPLVGAGLIDQAERRVAEALTWTDDAIATEHRPTTVSRLRASLFGRLAKRTRNPDTFAAAERAYAELALKSPYNIQDRLAWADVAWAAGDRDAAARRYTQVLELREQKYLDPADPLTPEDLARVRQVLADVPTATP